MKTRSAVILALIVWLSQAAGAQLPSWNEGPARTRIIDFVHGVTQQGSDTYVPPEARIAVFDNDGTLWPEQPLPTQLVFALDRVKALAPQHPEWKTKQPFKAVLENDQKTLAASGTKGIEEIMMVTHAGDTTAEFEQVVKQWIGSASDPHFKKLYTELAYQPMLEVLEYLRQNGFRTYIVSGGGIEFMRPWADRVYGVPPEQVIGSTLKTKYQMLDTGPVLTRLPEVLFIDDGPGKPEAINLFIGRRPIVCFGNSDGDQQMLEWTAAGQGQSLEVLVHHTDAVREWAYDRNTMSGRLDKALDEANQRGWLVVDMKNDWKTIFPPRP